MVNKIISMIRPEWNFQTVNTKVHLISFAFDFQIFFHPHKAFENASNLWTQYRFFTKNHSECHEGGKFE